METVEILQILAQGEDSKNQFKKDFTQYRKTHPEKG